MTTKNLYNLMLSGYIRCWFQTSNLHSKDNVFVVLVGPIAYMLYIAANSVT